MKTRKLAHQRTDAGAVMVKMAVLGLYHRLELAAATLPPVRSVAHRIPK